MFAGSALFLGEMFRRARWEVREISLRTAGMTTIRIRALPWWVVLLWSLVSLAVWAVLVPLPVVQVRAGRGASHDLWLISLMYGFIAAGFFGVFVVSFVKRLARRLPKRASSVSAGELRFWRIASVQWLVEFWFGFLAGGLFGVLPLSLASVRSETTPIEPGSVGVVALIAGGCAIIAVALAAGSTRSGYAEGVFESVV